MAKPQQTIAERLDALHAEIDALIEVRVEEIRKGLLSPIPAGVIRQTLVRGNCLCTAFRQLEKMK